MKFRIQLRIRSIIIIAVTIILLLLYAFSLSGKLFEEPYSTVLNDKEGRLLSAHIANDGQWRFPPLDSVPKKFEKCIIAFEDKYFYYHPGFNPISFLRALKQNILNKEIVSGGSTISMQTIRLFRKDKERNIKEKIIETILSTRLELKYSKAEILKLYCSHAPFGGNVVGLETASWRYFGCRPNQLSWAESATLAVLPNAPSMIHPGKNRKELQAKRNRLLKKLLNNGYLDTLTYKLSVSENIPQAPLPLPNLASHLLFRAAKEHGSGKTHLSTIDYSIQQNTNRIAEKHKKIISSYEVYNIGIIVAEVNSGEVLAYLGNTFDPNYEHENSVDVIDAPRSTGSVLKPFLYAAMMEAGEILPTMLIPDVPTIINGFAPQNYTLKYDGAVPAKKALSRSLNIPAVRMLRDYGIVRFRNNLIKLGFSTINESSDYYGLSLILGGAEAKLYEVTAAYANMARTLGNYYKYPNHYDNKEIKQLIYLKNEANAKTKIQDANLKAGSIWLTLKALLEVNRPESETGWQNFSGNRSIAWKTGTSFGYRDAWAVGVTPEYVVGVWVGNADGEGRPQLTGINSAAPIMFDVFKSLPKTTWFEAPRDELRKVVVCKKSGHLPSINCEEKDSIWIYEKGLNSPACPYHKIIHLNKERNHQVSSDCYSTNDMVHEKYFILPPIMEYYYIRRNPFYKKVPEFLDGCSTSGSYINFIYPNMNSEVFIPKDLNGEKSEVICKLAVRREGVKIHWHLDNIYIGTTENFHSMGIQPNAGKHVLSVTDNEGNSAEILFFVHE